MNKTQARCADRDWAASMPGTACPHRAGGLQRPMGSCGQALPWQIKGTFRV